MYRFNVIRVVTMSREKEAPHFPHEDVYRLFTRQSIISTAQGGIYLFLMKPSVRGGGRGGWGPNHFPIEKALNIHQADGRSIRYPRSSAWASAG